MKTVDQVCAAFEFESLKQGHSRNTRRKYLEVVREFSHMLKEREIDGPQAYFDFLSARKKLSPKSVKFALNPLKFLYERVLNKEFGQYRLPIVKNKGRIPCDLSITDTINIIAILDRLPRLQAALLAGTGMRVESDMLKLRLKDIHLADGVIKIQSGKGDKSRVLLIPNVIKSELASQIERCKKQWLADRQRRIICPIDSPSLMRKYGRATFATLPWYWLFPSQKVHGQERWHATDKRLSTALKVAAEELGITQRVHPHALRHTYATTLLRQGADIRTIQTQLGHSNIETTEIYLHAMGAKGVQSPLDHFEPGKIVPFAAPTLDPPSASRVRLP